MPIQLPQDAREYDYEDQVCALLLAHGYYLETRLVLKKGTEEVLEFDAVATPTDDYTNRKVIEIKSGSWGLADIFKLYGQIIYRARTGSGLAIQHQLTTLFRSFEASSWCPAALERIACTSVSEGPEYREGLGYR